ncbi:hypothetical protein RvY_15495 [Ramazzottius varieornatus]|uniref:Uncharacterized protein n=1 Tax=Ramazzottius varieornatus TaxID=947166 RepID=A0A1D1VV48_RAMVA|nr:hypothetical protein RvY_15495 [Ramazzottius varieornatus]
MQELPGCVLVCACMPDDECLMARHEHSPGLISPLNKDGESNSPCLLSGAKFDYSCAGIGDRLRWLSST